MNQYVVVTIAPNGIIHAYGTKEGDKGAANRLANEIKRNEEMYFGANRGVKVLVRKVLIDPEEQP